MKANVKFDAKPIYLSSSNHRKIMKVNDMDVASWKSIRPPTPQQRDTRSCGVYVIKVGLRLCTVITAHGARLGEKTRGLDFWYCYWPSDCLGCVMQYIE